MMKQENRVAVIDRAGKALEKPLTEGAFYIGSHPDCQLCLAEGSGIEPRHLLLRPSAEQGGYMLFNLSCTDLFYLPFRLAAQAVSTLAPGKSIGLTDNDRVYFGDYTLIYHGRYHAGRLQVDVEWPDGNYLQLNRPLKGAVLIRYMDPGDAAITPADSAQFKLELEGLPAHCFEEVAPGSVTFPNTRTPIVKHFCLHHPQKSEPVAGIHTIRLHVISDTQPVERVTVQRTIEIAPYYRHVVRIRPDHELPAAYRLNE